VDHARLLVTTTILKKVNILKEFCINGLKFHIRIIEDLEFGLTDDACLLEYENDNQYVRSEHVHARR
jgi:hypothetical protein